MIRWRATIYYRSEKSGTVIEEYDLKELEDLHNVVERGPHFDTVIRIEVERVNHVESITLTLEQASGL